MFGFTYKLLTLKRFCCNQVDFLQVLISVQNDTMLPKPKMPIQNALVIKLFFGMCAGVGFADLISGTYFVGPTWRLSPSWWCRQLVSLARYTMFMGPEPSLNFAPELSEIGWIDVFFSILTGCGLFQRYDVQINIIKYGHESLVLHFFANSMADIFLDFSVTFAFFLT